MNQNIQLLIERAVYSFQNNRLEDAISILKKALQIDARCLPAFQILGLISAQQSNYSKATEYFSKAVKVSPNDASAHYNLAKSLSMSGSEEKALHHLQITLKLTPGNPEAWLNYGNSLFALTRKEDALVAIDQALAINPDYVEALVSRAAVLKEMQDYELAIDAAQRAININNSFPPAWSNLAGSLKKVGRESDALEAYDKALSLDPSYKEAWYNKGVLLVELKRLEEASCAYDRALTLDPNYIDAQWNRALLQLWRGDYSAGWVGYEQRWARTGHPSKEFLEISELKQLSDAAGKKILVWSEQGLGDSIQFSRYLKDLSAIGEVTFRTQGALKSLFERQNFGVDVCVDIDTTSKFDYQIALLSLPFLFDSQTSNIPFGKTSYLTIEADRKDRWNKKVGQSKKMRVGLVWAGGFRPERPDTWEVNARRNITLESFITLRDLDIEFYSLQKGLEAENELVKLEANCWEGPRIIDLMDEVDDFLDTGALVECMDLVITVDTSIAHLSAALGKETWLLNRFDSCWRWLVDEEFSPWYFAIKVFNQPKQGDWDAVVKKVYLELENRLKKRAEN